MKEEINNNTIIVGDFNTPLTPMDRSTKQKINKETQTLNVTIDQCLFSSLAHFLIGSFIFLELSCISCLYIFEISCLSANETTVFQLLTPVHDYWKNHGFDYWIFVETVISAFQYSL